MNTLIKILPHYHFEEQNEIDHHFLGNWVVWVKKKVCYFHYLVNKTVNLVVANFYTGLVSCVNLILETKIICDLYHEIIFITGELFSPSSRKCIFWGIFGAYCCTAFPPRFQQLHPGES